LLSCAILAAGIIRASLPLPLGVWIWVPKVSRSILDPTGGKALCENFFTHAASEDGFNPVFPLKDIEYFNDDGPPTWLA
jgi:hypothetical protein